MRGLPLRFAMVAIAALLIPALPVAAGAAALRLEEHAATSTIAAPSEPAKSNAGSLIGGFLESMGLPVELTGEGIGQTRKIPMGATPTVERLEERDEDARRLVYSIVSGTTEGSKRCA